MTNKTTTQETSQKKDASAEPSNTSPQKQKPNIDYSELAKERNARVILHNVPDTYPLTTLARYADQSIRRLRNHLMITIPPEAALPLLNDYNEALVTLHNVVEKICALTNVKYRLPRGMENLLGENTKIDGEESIVTEETTKGSLIK